MCAQAASQSPSCDPCRWNAQSHCCRVLQKRPTMLRHQRNDQRKAVVCLLLVLSIEGMLDDDLICNALLRAFPGDGERSGHSIVPSFQVLATPRLAARKLHCTTTQQLQHGAQNTFHTFNSTAYIMSMSSAILARQGCPLTSYRSVITRKRRSNCSHMLIR